MGTAGAKVTVASRLPMRFEMQTCKKRIEQRRHQNQCWREEIYFKDGPMHVINGTAYPNGTVPEGFPPRPEMVAGYALTHGVDAYLYDAWAIENKDTDMLRNKLVFAFEKLDSTKGMAKDCKDLDSGLGPLVPDTDRRMPKKMIGAQTTRLSQSDPE
jgi:hypothetical protein